MDMQFWYKSAREMVDDVIELHFEDLSPAGHRQLARVWQFLRDQEVKEIQAAMKRKRGRISEFRLTPASSPSFGVGD